MESISVYEQYAVFVDSLKNIGTFLITCDLDDIEYCVFEEFDGDCISFLHHNTLTTFLRAGLITKEIYNMSLELAKKFRSFENTSLWNALSVKTNDEWREVLVLADQIKSTLGINK